MKRIAEYLGEVNYSSVLKRLLLLIIPIVFMPLGIACYYACMLGADPFSILVDGMHALTGLSYGQITIINNVTLLGLMLIFGRKYINIGTVITCFTTGPLIDLFWELIVNTIQPQAAGYIVQGAVLVAGCVLFAASVGVYIAVNLGIGPVDFIVLFFRDRFNFKLKYIRITMDAICVVAGYLMGGVVGVGTILGVLATGPIVEFTLKRIKDPIDNFAGKMKKESVQEGA